MSEMPTGALEVVAGAALMARPAHPRLVGPGRRRIG